MECIREMHTPQPAKPAFAAVPLAVLCKWISSQRTDLFNMLSGSSAFWCVPQIFQVNSETHHFCASCSRSSNSGEWAWAGAAAGSSSVCAPHPCPGYRVIFIVGFFHLPHQLHRCLQCCMVSPSLTNSRWKNGFVVSWTSSLLLFSEWPGKWLQSISAMPH